VKGNVMNGWGAVQNGFDHRVKCFGRGMAARGAMTMICAMTFAILLAGAVLTETTFSWPGIGLYLVRRIELRDYTAVTATIAVFAFFVAIISLFMDILYAFVDPRIRY